MLAPPEWLLGLALVAVYVCDSMHFLRIGEAVVFTRGGSLRGLSFGSSLELGGRRPYLPNPLTPAWPSLRVDWLTSARSPTVQQTVDEMTQQLRVIRPIAWLATACTGLIVVVAPLALVTGHEEAFVSAVVLCVLCALPACALVVGRRRLLGLTLGQAAAVTAVALVCLPCSGNLARAASLHRRWTVRASELSVLGIGQQVNLETQIRDMLTRVQRLCAEDSAEYRSVTTELGRMAERANEHH